MSRSRTIGIGMDYSLTSKQAVQWTVDHLVRSGDTVIIIHVLSGKGAHGEKVLWGHTGSPLIPLYEFMEMNLPVRYGINPDKEVLSILDTASRAKQIKVLAKIYWGDPREKLCEAVENLKLDNLVIGSRGLGPLKRTLLGSVSNYVVNNITSSRNPNVKSNKSQPNQQQYVEEYKHLGIYICFRRFVSYIIC